jgi:hypothetical protein
VIWTFTPCDYPYFFSDLHASVFLRGMTRTSIYSAWSIVWLGMLCYHRTSHAIPKRLTPSSPCSLPLPSKLYLDNSTTTDNRRTNCTENHGES